MQIYRHDKSSRQLSRGNNPIFIMYVEIIQSSKKNTMYITSLSWYNV